ncbi:MoaD/ThiS family protein [Stutzerimonas urumqiensis]|uniref:MoaD/ThiS family protein n=1 Tax=Stutzerimonas urumqiensis TaxID=638269 RepID=UPI000EAF5C85|nr:MoaD/ThiS family protein [Stutzerimonas urumqiensis]
MIRVQFFARYRETLGCDQDRLEWHEGLRCMDDVRASLVGRGGPWSVLDERNLMCARNDELCNLDEPVADGDVLAFFPTVTGG